MPGSGSQAAPVLAWVAQDEVTAFFARHHAAVRAYLVRSCGCAGYEADDIVQDTILVIRDRWERVRGLEKPAAYWYKIAGRRWRRVQGAQARRYAAGDPAELLLAVPAAPDGVKAADCRETAMALLARLPLRQRQVLWLRRAAGFSTAETAGILDVEPGTVKSQLHDAEARMRRLLGENGITWEAEPW